MNLKYKLNFKGIPFLCFAFFLIASFGVKAQITGGELKPDKKKKEKGTKVKTEFNTDSLTGTIYYFSGLVQQSFRKFEDNSVFDKHKLLYDETPIITGGAEVGVIVPLTKQLSLAAGLTYFGHGEAYAFKSTQNDSTYSYTHTYMQLGVPLKLRYTYGQNIQFLCYAGITPVNILNIRNKVNYTDSIGNPADLEVSLTKDGFSSFNVMVSGGIGVNYYFGNLGVFLAGEYRRHLMNTFADDTFKRVHKMYGIGLNLGVNWRI